MKLRTGLFPALLLAARVAAQDEEPAATREELLRRLREAKRLSVRPHEPNRIEAQFLALDKAEKPTISDLNWKGFYPRIAWPSRGSGAALGTRFWRRDLIGPLDAAGAAFYSIYGYQHYDVQFGLMPHRGREIPQWSWKGDELYEIGDARPGFPRFPLYLTLRYRYLPEEDFYGLGPDSSLSRHSTYLQEETRAYLRSGVQLTDHFVWIVEGGYQANSIGAGHSSLPSTDSLFEDAESPGFAAAPDYLRLGTQAFFDFRDEPGNPERGFMLAVLAERFLGRGSSAFSFDRYGFDGRLYAPLGSPQRILALRAAGNTDHPLEGGAVPFFLQESLGGSHTLRGYDSFRFRGEKTLLLQAEYRWEPAAFWELAVFTDAGTVGRTGSSLGSLNWDYGFGMRFKSYRDVILRFEVAFGSETTRYYIRSSQSF